VFFIRCSIATIVGYLCSICPSDPNGFSSRQCWFRLLEDGSLKRCAGISDAALTVVAAPENRLTEALAHKKESDFYSGLF
jgi:hypothetical protein